jgi:large subunit ribosomal protein L32
MTLPRFRPDAHCGQPVMSHRVCPNCGYYKGRQVIEPAEA